MSLNMRTVGTDDWRDSAACIGKGTRMFFDDIWPSKGGTDKAALGIAREVCDTCSVRQSCMLEELAVEGNTASQFRYGLRAGLTPAQRASLRRRPFDVRLIDPTTLRSGDLKAMDGTPIGTTDPLPDRGDDWLPRHDVLAKRVVAFMVENISVGDTMPSAVGLAKILGARKADVMRVYVALADDGTLVVHPGRNRAVFIRQSRLGAVKRWYAPHQKITLRNSKQEHPSQEGPNA